MKVSVKNLVTISAAGIGLFIIAYFLRQKLPQSSQQPDRITPNPLFDFTDIFPYSWGEHFVKPEQMESFVVLPVRYPPRAGHELSTIISQGFEPMFSPRSGISTWITAPPSEQGGY